MNSRSMHGMALVALGCVLVCAPRGAWTAANGERTLSLEAIRTGQMLGPFRMRDGGRVLLGNAWFELSLHDDERFSVTAVEDADRRTYGPFDAVLGRIIEVAGEAYAITRIGVASARVEPLPPTPPPSRTTEDAWVGLPGNVGLFAPRIRMNTVWIEPVRDTRLNWKIKGFDGTRSASLKTFELGASALWNGLEAEFAMVLDGQGGRSPIPDDFDVADVALDDGGGWRLRAGYTAEIYREQAWVVDAGVRLSWTRQSYTLRARAPRAVNDGGTNAVEHIEYTLEPQRTTLDFSELAAWATSGIGFHRDTWGVKAAAWFLLFSSIDIDAAIASFDGELALDASRSHPVGGTLSLWKDWDAWRFFADLTGGADMAVRFGVGQQW